MVPIELPEKYYLDYFEALLTFVQDKYEQLLSKQENHFIEKFRLLPEDARCLFVRLTNRRGCFFRIDKLQYAEIKDIAAALDVLIQQGFFSLLSTAHERAVCEWLHIFGKAELLSMITSLQKDLKKSAGKLKKREVVTLIAQELTAADLVDYIQQKNPVVSVNYEIEIEMMKFLYFGNIHGDMTQFVVRDIGYIKTETLDSKKLIGLFKNRREAEDKFLLSKIYQQFKDYRDTEQLPAEQIFDWFQKLPLAASNLSALAIPLFDKLCLRLGKLLEQQRLPKFALDVYMHTDTAPSRERRARLLHKLGLTQQAVDLCHQIAAAPQNAEEKYFAEDFCDMLSKKRRVKRTTHYLKASTCIEISEEARACVEIGALEYFHKQGYEGVFSENYLWRGFFGLFFWDIIFDQDSEALHNPLQTAPSDFYTPDFLKKRRKQIDQRLETLWYPERFLNIVRHHFKTKESISNPMVGWHESLLPLVEQCFSKLKPKQISSVLLEMAKNLRENTRGFPDLFIWNGDSYNFVEIKSPNDHLSAQQLYWLHFFEKHQIKAEVIRVQWR